MQLENLVVDALDPQLLGNFWEAAVGAERLTDEPGIYETRVDVEGGPTLDLCFQQVTDPPSGSPRLHVGLAGGGDRLLGLGARALAGAEDAGARLLADPEGNPFRVLDDPAAYAGGGPLATLALDSADPERDAAFWSWLTGWVRGDGGAGTSLRHPSGRGPVLELRAEREPKGPAKNRMHLDVRLERGEDADVVEASIAGHGGDRVRHDWGDLPWRTYTDPSGNEFCVLPASA